MVNSYLSRVRKLSTLSYKEQQDLFQKWLDTNDRIYFTKVYNSVLYDVAIRVIRLWNIRNSQIMDLIQEANDSILLSMKKYNPSYNVPLIAWVYPYIKKSTQIYFFRKSQSVDIPYRKYKELNFKYSSIDRMNDDDEGHFQYLVVSEDNVEENVLNKFSLDNLISCINSLNMSDRHKTIFMQHFVQEKTLQEIASDLNLTRERIRQICVKAKEKIFIHLQQELNYAS